VLWSVCHTTRYDYSAPVYLEPHLLRLRPASDASQRLVAYELRIEPEPFGRSENVDIEGNSVTRVWFAEPSRSLSIEARATVETLRGNAFDYLWDGAMTLPLRYEEGLREQLAPYTSDRVLGDVGALADRAAVAASGDAQAFPLVLATMIHKACKQVHREEGDPRRAVETLKLGEGSCRDLAQVFLEASRSKGFAARFVSGYVAYEDAEQRELHAWAEVYLPGGGWRGFDATTGLAAGEQHMVLARAAQADLAAPLSGSFRGAATAELSTDVEIRPA
jgi:transglutaminase-like putative cysteine protease